MTVYMKIHCFSCGGDWEVYERDDWKSINARTCPHCGRRINGTTWEKQVLPAFGGFADANRALEQDRSGYNAPLFKVDCIAKRHSHRNEKNERKEMEKNGNKI